MTARARLSALRSLLTAGAVTSSLLWGAVAASLLLCSVVIADVAFGLSHGVRKATIPAAMVVGLALTLALLWRNRNVRRTEAVALWLEERMPALRYALVTVADPHLSNSPPELERIIESVSWRRTVAITVARAIAVPLAVLVVSLMLVLTLPSGAVARVRSPRLGDLLDRVPLSSAARQNRLATIVAIVAPPAYTGTGVLVLENPSVISAMAGSDIRIKGRGAPGGIGAHLARATLHVSADDGTSAGLWQVGFAMPDSAAALVLADGEWERLVVLEPHPDSAPMITLLDPSRDTVLRVPKGTLPLAAQARDNLGLMSLWFEYIVSSGEGESFAFRSGIVRRTSLRGARHSTIRGALGLDSLILSPGDVVHLRAVARDGNPKRDAGSGFSETRTIRVARSGEYDSIAVEGAIPPETDKSALSQRMLIILTEKLQGKRRSLIRPEVITESRKLSIDQARLRRRVGEMIFTRLGSENAGEESQAAAEEEGGKLTPEALLRAAEAATNESAGQPLDFGEAESPVVAVNRPLLEAYNAMWGANRELDVGEPGRALPHMRAALEAIQRARQAERIYLRGRAPVVVVDLSKSRLAGSIDEARAGERSPRRQLDRARVERTARYAAAVRLLTNGSTAGLDSLLVLRIDAIACCPAAAAAISNAIGALRLGRDASADIARARRAITGEPKSRSGLPVWGGAW